MSKFHDMMMKKRDMKPSEKHAKMGVLKDLKDSLSDAMSDKMSSSPAGMKKVSVMSNSPEGLSAGLDKAKQIASQNSDQDPDQMMSEGGISMNTDPNETEHTTYEGTPHDDGFMAPNPNEAYSTGMPMTDKQSPQDPNEPEHVMYDGSSDQEMGPGFYEGGEMGPNEVMPDQVTYAGEGEDYGKEHADSDEAEHGEGYAEGGKVKNQMAQAADSVQDEREETEGDAGDDDPPEFKGMNLQEVEEKLQHLLRMKRQMEKQ